MWILGLTLVLDVVSIVTVIGMWIALLKLDGVQTIRYVLLYLCFAGMIRALVWLDQILYPDE
jgi:hypothetical protein